MNNLGSFALALSFTALACSSSGSNDSSNAGGGDGGTVAKDPGSSALQSQDCPGTPSIKSLTKVAPFWGGLILARVTIPQGSPDAIEQQLFDAGLNAWTTSYYYGGGGLPTQTPDNDYLVFASPNPRSGSQDKPTKLRVRASLDGCPKSAWVESETFTVTNPYVDSTWTFERAADDPTISATLNVFGQGTAKSVGPYLFTPGSKISHSVTFTNDGKVSESVQFKMSSKTPGDAYDGCTVQVAYGGTWILDTTTDEVRVLVSARTLTSTAGSVCASPAVALWNLSKPAPTSLPLSPFLLNTSSTNASYLGLLRDPVRPVTWSFPPFSIQNLFQTVLQNVGFQDLGSSAQVNGNLNTNGIAYLKK